MMKPSFDHALRYTVHTLCATPLRTGDAMNNVDSILYAWNGRPFLQGSSLAGALRSWSGDEQLFGVNAREGQLIISDLMFDSAALSKTRPRLRINGATGAAYDDGKFDVTYLPTGTKGSFELIWKGFGDSGDAQIKIERMLSALHRGLIHLGAQKSNGFGRVELSVRRMSYDLTSADGLAAWLEDRIGDEIVLNDISGEMVCFKVTAQIDSLLIKSAVGEGVGEHGVDAVQLTENGIPVIPGSSLKGSLRNRITMMAPYRGISREELDSLFGRANSGDDNGIAGKVRFSDAVIKCENEAPKVTRIRINRFTGGVIRAALFSERPVSGSCSFEITLPADQTTGCALVALALRDLGVGFFNIGGGFAVGRGRLSGLTARITAPDGSAAMECRSDGHAVTVSDADGLLKGWLGNGGDGQ